MLARLSWPTGDAGVRKIRRDLASGDALSGAEARTLPSVAAARQRLIELSMGVRSCGSCSQGCDGVEGRFSGGYCCSGPTADVFRDEELDLLRGLGARPSQYRGSGQGAGCSFRGPRGCVLGAEQRPSVCLAYACTALRREIAESGLGRELGQAQDQLDAAMGDFRRARAARLRRRDEAEVWDLPV